MKLSGIQLARMKGALDTSMLRGHSVETIAKHRLGIVVHELTWHASKDEKHVAQCDEDIAKLCARVDAALSYQRHTLERQLKDKRRWRDQAARDAKRGRASLEYLREHGLPHEVATYTPGCGSAVERSNTAQAIAS